MPSSYSPLLGLELINTGEQAGNWGNSTNNNLGTLLEQAIAGRSVITASGASVTLATTPIGTAFASRAMILDVQGSLSASCNVICPSLSKLYVVRNATTGGQNIVIKTSAGTGVTIGNGSTVLVFCDGTNVNAVEGIGSVNNLTISGTTQFTGTAQRIQGDFSNATLANRTAFQDKTTNNGTVVYALPNGTATTSGFVVFNNSDPTNAGYLEIAATATSTSITSARTGSGSALPLLIYVGTGGPEVARFLTGGQYCVGTTTANLAGQAGHVAIRNVAAATYTVCTDAPSNSGTFYHQSFGAAGSLAGAITGTASTVSYGTTSDYRLKENIQPMTGALAKVQALNPVTYTWKSSGEQGQGFVAHELQAVIPSAVTGAKDAVDTNGDPAYQNVDTSFVVATLVAAIKELSARVAALEAK
jgi:hypothetical protein